MSSDRENYLVWASVALGYHEVIRDLLARLPPTAESLREVTEIMSKVARDGKETEVPGLGIDEEARVMRKGLEELRYGLNHALAEFRKRVEDAADDDGGGARPE